MHSAPDQLRAPHGRLSEHFWAINRVSRRTTARFSIIHAATAGQWTSKTEPVACLFPHDRRSLRSAHGGLFTPIPESARRSLACTTVSGYHTPTGGQRSFRGARCSSMHANSPLAAPSPPRSHAWDKNPDKLAFRAWIALISSSPFPCSVRIALFGANERNRRSFDTLHYGWFLGPERRNHTQIRRYVRGVSRRPFARLCRPSDLGSGRDWERPGVYIHTACNPSPSQRDLQLPIQPPSTLHNTLYPEAGADDNLKEDAIWSS
ncbi:hypothetical protein C8Q74DRAFT_650154 [Fomes fomentarius]|nr:hypothetical protein C8Q74DRAFT_650154 [Fomes fomentarius]